MIGRMMNRLPSARIDVSVSNGMVSREVRQGRGDADRPFPEKKIKPRPWLACSSSVILSKALATSRMWKSHPMSHGRRHTSLEDGIIDCIHLEKSISWHLGIIVLNFIVSPICQLRSCNHTVWA